MDLIYIIIILLLIVIILFLSLAIYFFMKRGMYMSIKEKEFLIFVIDIYEQYSSELGIQSEEQHKKLCEELNKIKKKYLKNDKT